jgi:hypothetical protein
MLGNKCLLFSLKNNAYKNLVLASLIAQTGANKFAPKIMESQYVIEQAKKPETRPSRVGSVLKAAVDIECAVCGDLNKQN